MTGTACPYWEDAAGVWHALAKCFGVIDEAQKELEAAEKAREAQQRMLEASQRDMHAVSVSRTLHYTHATLYRCGLAAAWLRPGCGWLRLSVECPTTT